MWGNFERWFVRNRCTKTLEMSNYCSYNVTGYGRSSVAVVEQNDEYINGKVKYKILNNNNVAKDNE